MTTRRSDLPDASEPHDEFWGEQTEWTPQRPPSGERTGIGATFGRWWNALLGGGAVAGRAHGRSGASSPSDDLEHVADRELIASRRVGRSAVLDQDRDRRDRDRQDRDRQDHDGDDSRDDVEEGAWELEPEPQPIRHPGVDPLLARLGGLAVIITLAAPLVVGFTASGSDSQAAGSMLATVSTASTSAFVDPATTGAAAPAPTPATTEELTQATPATPAGSTPGSSATAQPETTASDAGDSEPDVTAPSVAIAAALRDAPEPAETAPQVTVSPCGGRYELAAGDYWIRIADAAGVSLSELLAVNDSSIDTVLVPGQSVCLPVGAATPSPPTTAAPAPVPTAPQTIAAPTRSTTTTAATTPTTPTTTAPSRPAAVSPSQAAAIIRDVWPDELEERALEIAWRESNHQSNVNNYCCYGLFQIHWTAHRSWLATIGVTSASQLFDPVVNATAAYTLYQRSGGFGPWGG